MDYLIIEVETLLLKTGKTNADLIRATGHTPANISKIRNAKIKGSGVLVTVSPNPATDQVKLFIAGTNGSANVQLINAAGQVVKKWGNISSLNGAVTLDVSALASGMYSILVITPEETTVQKLIIRN